MMNHHATSSGSTGLQPFDLLSLPIGLSRMMESFMSGAGHLMPFNPSLGMLSPLRIDVTEDDSALQLVAEMPGVQARDIHVELEGQALRISGHKDAEMDQRGERIHLKERSFGHFTRTVLLPFPAYVEQVCAEFCNGVLTLRVPKPEALKRPQHIPVRDRTREPSVPSTYLEPSANGLRPGIAVQAGAQDGAGREGAEEGADGDEDELAQRDSGSLQGGRA